MTPDVLFVKFRNKHINKYDTVSLVLNDAICTFMQEVNSKCLELTQIAFSGLLAIMQSFLELIGIFHELI